MRLPWRNRVVTPHRDEPDPRDREAEVALREAQLALHKARMQKKDGSLIAQTLASIREENHFREMWNKGIGS